jgi:transposase-like protein
MLIGKEATKINGFSISQLQLDSLTKTAKCVRCNSTNISIRPESEFRFGCNECDREFY